MKLKFELERTFAGKQYENLKPRIVLEYGEDEQVNLDKAIDKAIATVEKIGAKWQDEQLGKR